MPKKQILDLALTDTTDKVVAFLDVLGFKQILKDKKQVETYFNEVILEIDNLKHIKNMNRENLKAVLISDSIVLSYPFEDNILNLRELLVAVAKIQARLIDKGIWLRGAITIGELEIREFKGAQVVVGQALADAYEIETKLSIHPRVILDARVFKKVSLSRGELQKALYDETSSLREPLYDPMGDTDREGFALNSLLVSDAVWVNYLESIIEDEKKLTTFCELLKKDMYSSQAFFTKYKWVQSYLFALLYRPTPIKKLGLDKVHIFSEMIQKI